MARTDEGPDSVQGAAVSRRDFAKAIGLAGAAHGLPAMGALTEPIGSDVLPVTAPEQASPTGTASPGPRIYTYFTPDEVQFVEAAIDRLIPADDLGPGAREADVAVFIDRQLAGTYGTGGKWYTRGPWGESVPEQGYQLPLTPQQLYRLCIAAVDRHLVQQQGKSFSQLSATERDAVLGAMESRELEIEGVPLSTFFEMLLGNTLEGFFADPIHGGNRDKVGWRLVGFPGVGASYLNRVGRCNEPYRVEPVGISDVLERRVRRDEHGHVVHQPLDRESEGGGR